MEFRNDFDVALPPAEAWAVLMDFPRIVPCMPGAALTEQVDDRTFRGTVAVRLGPVALNFAGIAHLEEVDDANHRARVKATGNDSKGRGRADAAASFEVQPSASGSSVVVRTNLMMLGSIAQYGRGAGMIQDVAGQLIKQFATNLGVEIESRKAATATPEATGSLLPLPARATPLPPAAKPIGGFSLLMSALWRAVLRLFGLRSAT